MRLGKRPAPRSQGSRAKSACEVSSLSFALSGLDGGAEILIGISDQEREQFVTTRHVAIDGRGRHADVSGHRSHRERRRTDLSELTPGCGEDRLEHRLLGLGPDSSRRRFHGVEPRASAHAVRTCEHCSRSVL